MELADSHIHLFRDGYTSRYGTAFARDDEVALYEAFRSVHNIGPALVIGYEGDERFAGNNRYIAECSRQRPWVRPLQFRAIDNPPSLREEADGAYLGIALYAMTEEDSLALCRWPREAIELLNARNSIVNLNARPEALAAIGPFAKRLGDCAILVSHLGLPGAYRMPPTAEAAFARLGPLRELGKLSHVGVKISGLYAVSNPAHDYPHHSAYPFLNVLILEFGADRLYWGSDFSPALEHVSFAQTIDTIPRLGWSEDDMEAIMGGNLRRLLSQHAR